MSTVDTVDTTGRTAALEAIGDMLAVLECPADEMLFVLEKLNERMPGLPPLHDVARKARQIAARLTEPTDAP